jgi:ankyrin repeat protein
MSKWYLDAVRRGDIAQIHTFLEEGVSIQTRNQYQQDAIALATIHGQDEVVRYLIQRGMSVNGRDAMGDIALRYAVVNKRYNTACMLIEAKANLFASNHFGNNSFLSAMRTHSYAYVDLLASQVLRNGYSIRLLPFYVQTHLPQLPLLRSELAWLVRKSFLSFIDGCRPSLDETGPAAFYLYQEFAIHEICAFMIQDLL